MKIYLNLIMKPMILIKYKITIQDCYTADSKDSVDIFDLSLKEEN